MEAGVRLLAGRALSVAEIRQRLSRRGYEAARIDECIETLLRLRYLDDRTLAYNVGTSLATRKLFGLARVAAELRRRGLDAAVVAEALERVFAGLDEDEMARRALAAPAGGAAKARERLARGLLRRGFSRGSVVRALRARDRTEASGQGEDGPPGPDDDAHLEFESGEETQAADDDEL